MNDRTYLGWRRWLLFKGLHAVYRTAGRAAFRPHVTGLDAVPDGAFLLLGNHTSVADNVWVAGPIGRPTHIMTGSGLFKNPIVGGLLRAMGCFPKAMGTRDPAALDAVRERLAHGQIVQIMPEGTRTWDGRLQTIRPSIGKLVKALGVPVVLCRTDTGHLWWPRWAKYPRFVPVHMTYIRLDWPADADPDTIWSDITTALEPPTHTTVNGPGFRIAEGLESFLWACPTCFARETYTKNDTFGCRACKSSWTVSVDNQLSGPTNLSVRQAWDAIDQHFGSPPTLESNAVLKSTARWNGERGPCTVTDSGIQSPRGWLPFSDIRTVYMDAGNVVRLRLHDGGSVLIQPDDSGWMWFHILSGHLTEQRLRESTSR